MDANSTRVFANQQHRLLFGRRNQHLNRPLQDVEVFCRPLDLRGPIEQVLSERHPVSVRQVPWPTSPDQPRFLDIPVQPILDPEGALRGAGIAFTDVTRHKGLFPHTGT